MKILFIIIGMALICAGAVYTFNSYTHETEPVTETVTVEEPAVTEPVFVATTTTTTATTTTTTPAKCYVGGCSSQTCSDTEGMVSTCIYKPEYACYRTATCERQASGMCGWTQTPAFAACLANPPTE